MRERGKEHKPSLSDSVIPYMAVVSLVYRIGKNSIHSGREEGRVEPLNRKYRNISLR